MKDLILIGIQGSGKGTQARILAEKKGYQIFETGEALREIAKENSELGRKVSEITTRGDLVPNEIVMEIVADFIEKQTTNSPIIFDGIPRSEEQRESLENLLAKFSRNFQVLEIKLSHKHALGRLLKRAKCNDCGANFGGEKCPKCGSSNISRRADDNEEAIKNRLENFDKYTLPLLDNWHSRNLVIKIDGEKHIDEVTRDILEKLN